MPLPYPRPGSASHCQYRGWSLATYSNNLRPYRPDAAAATYGSGHSTLIPPPITVGPGGPAAQANPDRPRQGPLNTRACMGVPGDMCWEADPNFLAAPAPIQTGDCALEGAAGSGSLRQSRCRHKLTPVDHPAAAQGTKAAVIHRHGTAGTWELHVDGSVGRGRTPETGKPAAHARIAWAVPIQNRRRQRAIVYSPAATRTPPADRGRGYRSYRRHISEAVRTRKSAAAAGVSLSAVIPPETVRKSLSRASVLPIGKAAYAERRRRAGRQQRRRLTASHIDALPGHGPYWRD